MLNRPGILVQVSSQVAVPAEAPSPSTFFVAGYAPWGPVNVPVYIGDVRSARAVFGDPVTPQGGMWLPRILKHYLEASRNTGRAWVVRGFEIGAGPSTIDTYIAKVILDDAATTPAPVLTVKGAWAGALGNSFKVDVINTGLTTRIILWGRYGPEILDWSNDQATMQARVAAWNTLADQYGSDFRLELAATFVPAGPAITDAATSLLKPSATAKVLTGGSDGNTSNFPLSELYGVGAGGDPKGIDALADKRYGPGIVAIPGYTPTNALINALDAHCALWGRQALVSLIASGGSTQLASAAVTQKNALPASSYTSYLYPRIKDDDGVLSPAEGIVAGFAAAKISRLDAEGGIKATPTGTLPIAGAELSNGRELVKDAEADLLFANNVNYIMFVNKQGYRLESAVLGTAEGSISRFYHRNVLNYFRYLLEETILPYRDATLDSEGILQNGIQSAIRLALDPYAPGKASPNGNTLYNAATTVADNSVQNEADLNRGILNVFVSASLSPKAERIQLLFNAMPVKIG